MTATPRSRNFLRQGKLVVESPKAVIRIFVTFGNLERHASVYF